MQNPILGLPWRNPARMQRLLGGLRARARQGSSGQGMVEYSLILLLIVMVVIVVLTLTGQHVSDMYSNVANSIPG